MADVLASRSLPKESTMDINDYPLVYEIDKRSASQWKQKNPDPRKAPKVINSSKIMTLAIRSKWRAGDKIGNVDIQYVPGAPTIFVNDYVDAAGNVQPGLKRLYPNGELENEQYRRGIQAGVCFVDGYLFLENFGGKDNRLLREFVYHHALNTGNPNYKPQRDINGMLLFRPFQAEKKAEVSLESWNREMEGTNLLFTARDGKGVYDPIKLNAFLSVYGVGGDLGPNDYNQKMQLLIPYVKHNPVKFIDEFEKMSNDCRLTIGTAENLGVLITTSKDVKLKVGKDIRTIKSFDKEDADKRIESLIYYFLGDPAGQRDLGIISEENEVQKLVKLKA